MSVAGKNFSCLVKQLLAESLMNTSDTKVQNLVYLADTEIVNCWLETKE
jgi:hypothetical protein